jgi:hypothetical protein
MKKRLASCSKTLSYTKVKTAPALLAGGESASEPSISTDTEINVLYGECNTAFSTAGSISLKHRKIDNFETNSKIVP